MKALWRRSKAHFNAWLDRYWYGRPRTRPPNWPPALSSPLWLGGLPPRTLLATHQHQHDGRQTTPNDCAVASMTMIIHQALLLAGHDEVHISYADLARAMDRAPLYGRWFYRVPWVGAVPPGRAAAALRCLAQAFVRHGSSRPWRTYLRGRQTVHHLVEHLRQGQPTLLYGRWPNGLPHVVVLAGYEAAADRWYILDPAYPSPYKGRPAFRVWSTAELCTWWGHRYFAYQRYTALWLADIPRSSRLTVAAPVPKALSPAF